MNFLFNYRFCKKCGQLYGNGTVDYCFDCLEQLEKEEAPDFFPGA